MAKDPAVLFYTNDFISGTFTMSDEQVGKYIRLLCIQHQKGFLTEKDMLNICKSYDEDIYSKFQLTDGKYINERMHNESERRRLYSESRRKNRENAVSDSKTGNSKKDMIQNEKTYDKHMETETETITVIENDTINITAGKKNNFDDFNKFWDLYDKKVGSKDKIIKKFNSLTTNQKEKIFETLPEYVKSTPDKTYRKNPETYLNNHSWNDEIIKFTNNGKQTSNSESKQERMHRESEALERLIRNVTT